MRKPLIIAAALVTGTTSPALAHTQKSIVPYIEIGQVLTADLDSGDVLTYSTLAAGVDATIQTRRTQAQVSYRYERRFSWDKDVGDDDIHSGLARAAVGVAPGLTLEGGVLATRARSDIRGAAPGVLAGNVDNISQVYSLYAGPTYATQVGAVNVNALYRYSYTKVEEPSYRDLTAGSVPLDNYDSASSHLAQVSAGVRPGVILPVGLTASAAYEREDARQLDQRYEGRYLRGDAVWPVLPTLALLAGVGYEKIEVSQKDALVDANGVPVTDGNGRYQIAPGSPRRIAYQTDGLIYDAGVMWRPSPRTTMTATVGRRYGGTTYTGSLTYAASRTVGMQLGVYDSVQTFGRQLRDGLSNLPTSFIDQRDAFSQQFTGCTFGTSGASTGGCLNDVFQSIATASYRARGVDGVVVATRGALSFGAGVGYANRRFYAPESGTGYTIDGVTDQSYYAQGFIAYAIDRNSGVNADVFANYYQSGIFAAPHIFSTGLTGTYYRNFGRISTAASAGLYTFSQEGGDSDTSLQAQLAARYRF